MTHTADDLAILAAVCAAPDDDVPRLVYADWLDETAGSVQCPGCNGAWATLNEAAKRRLAHETCPTCDGTGLVSDGRAERAELIRVQCELAAGVECLMQSVGMREAGSGKPLACWQVRQRNKRDCLPWCAACERLAGLRARERELFGPLMEMFCREDLAVEFGLPNHESLYPTEYGLIAPGPCVELRFGCGFPDEVRCTLAAWCGGVCECRVTSGRRVVAAADSYGTPHCPTCKGTGRTPSIAGDVVRAAPTVTRVVTDAEPYWNGAGYCWYDASRPPPYHNVPVSANLPRPVFDGVKGWVAGRSRWKGFPKRDAALDALSAALVAHGREASGLGWWGGTPGGAT